MLNSMEIEEFNRQMEIISSAIPKPYEPPKSKYSHTHTVKQKEKIRKKALRRGTCPHCGLETNLSNLRRYHMKNCKNFYLGRRVENVVFQGKSVPKTIRNKKLQEYIAAVTKRKKRGING